MKTRRICFRTALWVMLLEVLFLYALHVSLAGECVFALNSVLDHHTTWVESFSPFSFWIRASQPSMSRRERQ